jgi:hypothetical protein
LNIVLQTVEYGKHTDDTEDSDGNT